MIIIATVGAGLLVAGYALHLIGLGTPSCGCGSSSASSSSGTHFSVVMSLNGFNDSKIHRLPWPIMNVTLGQKVTIHLANCDTTQSHGFSITNSNRTYVRGVTVAPNQCLDVAFTADTLGTFQVQCTIFCTIHIPWMFNGKFNVNP